MFSQGDEGQQSLVLTVVFGIVGFVLALVLMLVIAMPEGVRSPISPAAAASGLPAVVSPTATTSAASAEPKDALSLPAAQTTRADQAREDAASVEVERDVVRFYFASGKSELPPGAADALTGLLRAAGEKGKLVVSGFHDASGDPSRNAELARRRALSVRDALIRLGVRAQQIELRKPELAAAAGTEAEARRVEITLQ